MMRPNYVIQIDQEVFNSFIKAIELDYQIETEWSLFESKLVRIEPLKSPDCIIFHIPFRYRSSIV